MPSQQDEDDPWVGRELAEQVEVLDLIGVGAMGRVYRGHQKGIERPVAVKVLHADLMHRPGVMERFHREARVASRLNHPNVVQVLMTGEVAWRRGAEGPSTKQGGVGRGLGREGSESVDDNPSLQRAAYLVMEYLDGGSLASILEKHGGPLRLERALHIALQVCDAVGEAHDQGIVHRDLKPENVMLVRRGGDPDFVKVLDFGVAKVDWLDGAQATQVGTVFGTARYMAPEAARGELVTPRSDVYSIATLFYQCLAGRTPFDGTNTVAVLVKQCSELPEALATIAPHVPAPIARVVHRNLSKAPSERCTTARELGAALLSAAREAKIEGFAAAARPTLHGSDNSPPTDPFPEDGGGAPQAGRLPRETTLVDPELAGTPPGGEPQLDRPWQDAPPQQTVHTVIPGELLAGAEPRGPRTHHTDLEEAAGAPQQDAGRHSSRSQYGSQYAPLPGSPYPSQYGSQYAPQWPPPHAGPPANLWPGEPPQTTPLPAPRRRLGSAARWALGLTAVVGLAAGGAYVAAQMLGARQDSLSSLLDRANSALAQGSWTSETGEGFVELTSAALTRYPGATEVVELRERGARRMAREARRLEHLERERAVQLARLAAQLAPDDDAVGALTASLLSPPAEVASEAGPSQDTDAEASSAPPDDGGPETPPAPTPVTVRVPGPLPKPPGTAPVSTQKPAPSGVQTSAPQTGAPRAAGAGAGTGKASPPTSPPENKGAESGTAEGPETPRERWL